MGRLSRHWEAQGCARGAHASEWQEHVADAEEMVTFWERNLPQLEELAASFPKD